jgi:tetratricopeptide (TPR) repeat protein
MSLMATVTAPEPPTTRPDPTRRLWQVPAFLLGVAAFLAVWGGWLPLGKRDPAATFLGDVRALRAAAEQVTPDTNDLRTLLNRVAEATESFPEHGAAAHFALGSGYVRLAELTANLADARNYWVLAKQHFSVVRPDQLADPADPPRLAFRAAKAQAADLPPNTPPAEIRLTRDLLVAPPTGDDPGDGYRLAAELSLRLVPPELQPARTWLAAYISEVGLATPTASLARAKLRLSEVYLALNDPEGAQKWLKQIGPDAPPDVLPVAKAQLARIRMKEGDWAGAEREWDQVRAIGDLPPGVRTVAAYHLALCRLERKPPERESAGKLFDEASRADGPEGPAASLKLAELVLQSDDRAKHPGVVGLLAAGVKGATTKVPYANPLVPAVAAQAIFEQAVRVLVADGAFESAVAVTESYAAVAAAGRERERRAEVLAAWGESLRQANGDAAPKFAAAAEEYTTLAALRPAETDKAAQLRLAASLYRKAGNTAAELAALKQILGLPNLPEDLRGGVGVEYAKGLTTAGRPQEALDEFKKLIRGDGPAATAARDQFAHLLIDSRVPANVELGMSLLEQIANAEQVSPAEQEIHERALVTVAREEIRKGNYVQAGRRLDKQIRLYKEGAQAGFAKLLLGVCLVQQAAPKANPPATDPKKNREDALQLFKQVVAEVDARRQAGRATDRDPWLRTQAALRVLQTHQQLGQPAEVLADGDKLRWEVAGTADELIVLSLMYHAYKQRDKPEGALDVHRQMREVFDKLKDKPNVFWAKTGEYSREYWEKVWFAPDPPAR